MGLSIYNKCDNSNQQSFDEKNVRLIHQIDSIQKINDSLIAIRTENITISDSIYKKRQYNAKEFDAYINSVDSIPIDTIANLWTTYRFRKGFIGH